MRLDNGFEFAAWPGTRGLTSKRCSPHICAHEKFRRFSSLFCRNRTCAIPVKLPRCCDAAMEFYWPDYSTNLPLGTIALHSARMPKAGDPGTTFWLLLGTLHRSSVRHALLRLDTLAGQPHCSMRRRGLYGGLRPFHSEEPKARTGVMRKRGSRGGLTDPSDVSALTDADYFFYVFLGPACTIELPGFRAVLDS